MSSSETSTRRSSTKKSGHRPSVSTATSQLLTATKALLQSLTAWALQETPVDDVSSKFVKFGDTFKLLKRSYSAVGLNIFDIPDVPGKLRSILEQSLVLKPSQESLDIFLPRMGEAVAEMMQMLKEKQVELAKVESRNASNISLNSNNSSNSLFNNGHSPSKTPIAKSNAPAKELNKVDPMSRLQHNSGLMRRASKRFSAYQTNSIISMHSPKQESSFNTSTLPATPEYDNKLVNINESDIEDKKEEIQKRLSSSPSAETTIENVLMSSPHPNKILQEVSDEEPAKLSESTETGLHRVFLKIKNDVKKVSLRLPTSQANIKVLFTQKFNYSPPGASAFPPIYIQESPGSVAYELENTSDIKPDSILSLHELDLKSEIFKHVDIQIDSVKVDLTKIEDRITKKLELMSLSGASRSQPSTPALTQNTDSEYEKKLQSVIQARKNEQKVAEDLKFELNKLKQHHERSINTLKATLEEALLSASQLEANVVATQGVENNPYMKECKDKVSNGCEELVIKLDDLQDIIEVLKTDITKRGAKPSSNQVLHISKEMQSTNAGLKDLVVFMSSEKKNWTSLWSKTLNSIVEDQQFFKAQEEILSLLEQDYQSASETFDLIVKCVEELEKGAAVSRPKLPIADPSISAADATRMLFAEVGNINPNHEERVEAIKKLERVRVMEKKILMKDDFQEELGDFVQSEKLKKKGGIQEMEKLREEKDKENLKSMFGAF